MKPRIVLVRNLFSNVGDEAMLACEVQSLKSRFPSASLLVLTDHPTATAAELNVDAGFSDVALLRPRPDWSEPSVLRRPAVEKAVAAWRSAMTAAFDRSIVPDRALPGAVRMLRENIESADVIISGGGLMPSHPDLYRSRLSIFRLARRLGKPLILSGQSLFPFTGSSAPYRLATRVVLRDDSFSRLNGIAAGLDPTQLIAGIDPAFELEPAAERDVDDALLGIGVTAGERFIAVNVRSGRINLDELAKVVSSVLRDKAADRIVLFGMQRYWRQQDDEVTDDLATRLKGMPVSRAPTWSAPLLKGVLRRAQATVACRYHAAVFSLTSATPCISIPVSDEYRLKLGGIHDQFQRPEWLTQHEQIGPQLMKVLEQRDQLSLALAERRDALSARGARLMSTVDELLSTGSTHRAAHAG